MTREEIIRNLKYTIKKHKDDKVGTFDTNIVLMCKDILDYLEQEITANQHPNIVNASEIKKDDEWMQENEWDEVYKKETHENARKHTETHECDYIDRRAAIDALHSEYHGMISDETMRIYEIIRWLNELPPVSPTIPTCEDVTREKQMLIEIDHLRKYISKLETQITMAKAWCELPGPYETDNGGEK